MQEFWYAVGLSWQGALAAVLSTVVMYVLYVLIAYLVAPRLRVNPSVFSLAVTVMLAAIIARATLGRYPTLIGGLIVVATLLTMELSLGRIGLVRRFGHHLTTLLYPRIARPTILMIEGEYRYRGLRRRGLTERALLHRLRVKGVLRRSDAALVIAENRGTLTVMRTGETIDAAMLSGINGADEVPERLLTAEEPGRGPQPR